MRIFSGIQPTGAKHLGNYIGAIRQYVATQEQGDAFFCIVDLHSITVEYDPSELRESTLSLAALLFAAGLDPERSTVFVQSHVPAHPEAAWLLGSVTSFGELRRMTQFKDKADAQEFVSAGLFSYPVLQAADILLYRTDIVPIREDHREQGGRARRGAGSGRGPLRRPGLRRLQGRRRRGGGRALRPDPGRLRGAPRRRDGAPAPAGARS